MAAKSSIEWTDRTWNPLRGCKRKSEGCRNCYAERVAWRFGAKPGTPYFGLVKMTSQGPKWTGDVRFVEEALNEPFSWRTPSLVFVNSMSDLFLEDVPFDFVDKVFAAMALTGRHTYQVLTKRPGRARQYCEELFAGKRGFARSAAELRDSVLGGVAAVAAMGWTADAPTLKHLPRNIHLGTSVEDQRTADERIPDLLLIPGAGVLWISAEPLLGPIELDPLWLRPSPSTAFRMGRVTPDMPAWTRLCSVGLRWVVAGGESGSGARPMHPDWVRSLRDQCAEAGVPFLFKQWGEWLPISQQDEAFTQRLYRPNRRAAPHEDQGAIDDLYGRTCTVPHGVVHLDGSFHEPHEPMAFPPGAMATFKVSKKAAGRLLDGVLHDAYPEVPACPA